MKPKGNLKNKNIENYINAMYHIENQLLESLKAHETSKFDDSQVIALRNFLGSPTRLLEGVLLKLKDSNMVEEKEKIILAISMLDSITRSIGRYSGMNVPDFKEVFERELERHNSEDIKDHNKNLMQSMGMSKSSNTTMSKNMDAGVRSRNDTLVDTNHPDYIAWLKVQKDTKKQRDAE